MLYPVKQLYHFKETDTVTSLYSHLHHTRVRQLSHWIASIHYLLATVSSCKYLPSYPSPKVLNISRQIKPKTYGYEPSVTDASKPKKQIYQKCSATISLTTFRANMLPPTNTMTMWIENFSETLTRYQITRLQIPRDGRL